MSLLVFASLVLSLAIWFLWVLLEVFGLYTHPFLPGSPLVSIDSYQLYFFVSPLIIMISSGFLLMRVTTLRAIGFFLGTTLSFLSFLVILPSLFTGFNIGFRSETRLFLYVFPPSVFVITSISLLRVVTRNS